jgi:hypothetical protein
MVELRGKFGGLKFKMSSLEYTSGKAPVFDLADLGPIVPPGRNLRGASITELTNLAVPSSPSVTVVKKGTDTAALESFAATVLRFNVGTTISSQVSGNSGAGGSSTEGVTSATSGNVGARFAGTTTGESL